MKAGFLGNFWILLFQSVLWAETKRPTEVYNRPYPNVIYKYVNGSGVPPKRDLAAKAGDTCNFDHRDFANLIPPVAFSMFELTCEPPTICEYVMDKHGLPIALTEETIEVTGFPDENGNGTSNAIAAIYYKKCLCPLNHTYTHSDPTCKSEPPEPPAYGIYCSGANSGIHAHFWILFQSYIVIHLLTSVAGPLQ